MLRTTLFAVVLAVSSIFSVVFADDLPAGATSTKSLVAKVHAEFPAFFKNDPNSLIETINAGVNFGTDMIIVTEGCGSPCQTGLAININTSKIIKLPTASYGYDFRRDYRLLVVNPNPNDWPRMDNRKLPDWLYREMYTVQNGKFVLYHKDKAGPHTLPTEKVFEAFYIIPASD